MVEIAKKIEKAGGRLYLVGGAVRDKIMNKKVHDKDYCVVGIDKKMFKEMFPKAIIRGKDFPVFDLNGHEFALARKEKKVAKGHKGFTFETNKTITIKEDLERRDITINAIAMDVLTEKIIDPFNGIKDIENKVIRAVSEKFKEDPLRVYRVARFATVLNFSVDKETIKLMKSLKNELNTISKERVFCEFRKALNSQKPSIFFNVLREADVLDVHFKEIYDLIDVPQPIKYHPEGDCYNHTLIVVDEASILTNNEQIRFAALVHDLGKGVTPKEIYPHHYGHNKAGIKVVENFCKRIGVPKSWMKCGKISSREHMLGGIFWKMTPAKQVDFLERVNKSILGLEGMQIVVMADKKGRGDKKKFLKLKKPILEEINGEFIKKKYNIEDGLEIKKKIREERIRKMREILNKYEDTVKNKFN